LRVEEGNMGFGGGGGDRSEALRVEVVGFRI